VLRITATIKNEKRTIHTDTEFTSPQPSRAIFLSALARIVFLTRLGWYPERRSRMTKAPRPPKNDSPEEIARFAAEVRALPTETSSVIDWMARRYVKRGSPDSVRVSYAAGSATYVEWIFPAHDGPLRLRTEKWWRAHGGAEPTPQTADEALSRWDELTPPVSIVTRKNGKWQDIVGRTWGDGSSTHRPRASPSLPGSLECRSEEPK
jgi:hypothetical protein